MKKTLVTALLFSLSLLAQQNTRIDCYEFERDGKRGKVNSSGTVIIPAIYDSFGEDNNGLIPAELNGKHGVIDLKNQTIIPFVYDFIKIDKTLINVTQNSKEGWVNFKNEIVIPLEYYTCYLTAEGTFLVTKDEKDGMLDAKGNVIIPIQYDKLGDYGIGYCENKIIFKKGKKYGYLDRQQKVIIEPKFDYALSFHYNKAIAVMGKKYGIINEKGEFVVQPEYDNLFYDEGIYRSERNGKEGCLDKNGTVLLDTEYDDVDSFADGLAVVQKDNKYGLIDKKGKFVIPLIYDGARYCSEGLAPVLKDGKWGFVDKKNKVVIDFKFTGNVSWFRNGTAIYYKRPSSSMAYNDNNDLCGLINKKGEIIINPKYKSIGSSFENGVNIVEINGRDYLIDRNEKIIFDLKKIDLEPVGFSE